MAFEAFKAQSESRARSGRKRLWYALSIGFHGALLAVGIAYSFWHIEELSPPLLKVTFLSAAPPPPPAAPPPPAGGSGPKTPKKTITKPKVVVKPEIVQPTEIPKKEAPREEPKSEDHGEKDGVKGGTIGGTAGGTIGGTQGGVAGGTQGGIIGATAPVAPKFLPPNIGLAQKVSGGDPPFPPSLRRPGAVYHVLAKVCVSINGAVDKVTIMKSTESQLDGGVIETLRSSWRFRPYMANAMPIPFCTIKDFEFKTL